jgi:hypothetical protein
MPGTASLLDARLEWPAASDAESPERSEWDDGELTHRKAKSGERGEEFDHYFNRYDNRVP